MSNLYKYKYKYIIVIMGGAVLQLVSYGKQSDYLIGNQTYPFSSMFIKDILILR